MNAFARFLEIILLGSFLMCPFYLQGQGNPGNNAVFNSSGTCSQCMGSSAFIDAFILFQTDICTTLNNILKGASGSFTPGAVIDARGISGTTALTCSSSPWGSGSGYQNKPSTILLPSGTIQIPITWVLPNGTKLIGEGTSGPNDINGAMLTTIQAESNFSGAMIQFGDATHCPSSVCTGISLEHLILDGTNQTITGILNQNAQDLSYVDHVTLYRIAGTGLSIGANLSGGDAHNSGPYSNINFDVVLPLSAMRPWLRL